MEAVYWIVGSPCAGKSTIADILAQEHHLRVYHIDRHFESYLQRALPEKHPNLTFAKNVGVRFLALPHEEQLQRVQQMSAEQFEFILADLYERLEDDPDTPIIVDGSNIRLQDVRQVTPDVSRIICIVPTEEFLFKTYPRRGTWVQDVLNSFPDDQRLDIFESWMTRDANHARRAAQSAQANGVPVIHVDGSRRIIENAALVEAYFGLPDLLNADH